MPMYPFMSSPEIGEPLKKIGVVSDEDENRKGWSSLDSAVIDLKKKTFVIFHLVERKRGFAS